MNTIRNALAASLLLMTLVGSANAQSSANWNWNHVDDGARLSVKMSGEFEFTDNDSAVKSMSSGSHIRIRSERGRRSRRLDIERVGGQIRYDYREDGERIAFEAARTRIGELLLHVIRESGINADKRVARLLHQGGPEAVFGEIELIEGSGSSAKYLRELVAQGDLDSADLRETAKLAVSEVASSGDRSRLLITTAETFLADQDASGSWVEAVSSISSSGDKSRTLIRAMREDLGPEALIQVLAVARTISSSGDKSRVLIAAGDHFENSDGLREVYFGTARTIASSGDLSRVLIALARGADLDNDSMIGLLETARVISSSGDKSRVLIAAARYIESESAEAAYLDTAETISSSGDRGRALTALMRNS
jgi:bla regulator protein blaR1